MRGTTISVVAALVCTMLLTGMSAPDQAGAQDGLRREGMAAYFAKELHGRRTYSGEKCDMWDLTCAHPSLPMDSMVRVMNPETHQYCDVRVTDRGPFGGTRIIDVSYAAARELGMLDDGVCQVVLAPLIDLSPETLTSYWKLFDLADPLQPAAPR